MSREIWICFAMSGSFTARGQSDVSSCPVVPTFVVYQFVGANRPPLDSRRRCTVLELFSKVGRTCTAPAPTEVLAPTADVEESTPHSGGPIEH